MRRARYYLQEMLDSLLGGTDENLVEDSRGHIVEGDSGRSPPGFLEQMTHSIVYKCAHYAFDSVPKGIQS